MGETGLFLAQRFLEDAGQILAGEAVPPLQYHPFPVTDDGDTLIRPNSIAEVGIAHNGIISLTSRWNSYKSETPEERSDTYYFVKDYATLIVDGIKYHEDERISLVVDNSAPPTAVVSLVADFFSRVVSERSILARIKIVDDDVRPHCLGANGYRHRHVRK